jgi:hypothetical protein
MVAPKLPEIDEFLIDREEFLAFLADQERWVNHCLGDSEHESWMPSLTVLGRKFPTGEKEATMFAYAVPFNEDDEKRGVLFQSGLDCFKRQLFPSAVVLASEAWKSRQDESGRAPRDMPDRSEVILCMGLTADGKHCGISDMEVSRGPARRILPGRFVRHHDGVPSLLHWFFHGFLSLSAEAEEFLRRKFGA